MGELALVIGQVFNGFSVASLFVLAALGLALSFGLMRIINMAHGEMLMLGGYLAYLTFLVVPGPLAIFVAMPVAFIGTPEKGAYTKAGSHGHGNGPVRDHSGGHHHHD